jgi:hypothetical protein
MARTLAIALTTLLLAGSVRAQQEPVDVQKLEETRRENLSKWPVAADTAERLSRGLEML